jgi:UDPglucose--hexose-1-phosphate uridylyltransferase
MPELRKDPVLDRWVIIAADRGNRPLDFIEEKEKDNNNFSPFAAGNESMTPPEIYAIRPNDSAPNSPGWTLRIIPNKYPALKVEGELNKRGEGIFDMMNGIGAHEVIIETPDPEKKLEDLDNTAVKDIFQVFKERILDLKKDIRLKYAIVFKNKGFAAGASLKHAHSQLIATPIIPKNVIEELSGSESYYELKERCIFCDIIRQEIKDNIRVVYEEELFVVIEPFAPRFPFETWVLPKKHFSHYETIDNDHLFHLAITMKTVLKKINSALQEPAYNFLIHTAPLQEKALNHYHWHLELIPRITNVAGFEWGSGFYINSTSPEDAARYLKEISV